MRVILLTQSQHTVVDDDVFEWASKFKWCAKKDRNTFYAVRTVQLPNGKRTTRRLHREILKAPSGILVDHADGSGLNNLDENIRLCSSAENSQNRTKSKDNTSGYRGVGFHPSTGKWRARIRVGGSPNKSLGLFDCVEEAARAYDAAATILHGAFARLNFPPK